ncbi:hypothetical protein GGTG_11752 [Gaeumannomyces tritici R3-111a-1]|uniref:Intramembrane protease 2 n=1 Tax=Gaeumannomyces tritici (strain R3-111a-1) TaxID=644352 RepID=J3PE29_GAET3|nr:hypothetical protein GGTG_11752 [Gaeumannomyces tritici R3-111a-1]EJT70729.1 hypothetical protein GGTG_11752 [Gaeumannomyces tritici R3-111a-1]
MPQEAPFTWCLLSDRGCLNLQLPSMPTLEELLSRVDRDLVIVQLKMVLSAMSIIYIGAHGALRRPPSAAPRVPRTRDGKAKAVNAAARKEEESFAEGFQATDAIVFPVLAAVALIGLYYLLHWLDDPDILSKFMRYYFSLASLASLGKLMGDALHLATGFVFPNIWADQFGRLYRFDLVARRQLRRVSAPASAEGGSGAWEVDESKDTTFPGPGPLLLLPLPLFKRAMWTARMLLKESWTVKLGLHGVGFDEFQVTLNGVLGFLGATAVAAAYHITDSSSLSNLMAAGMSYGAFMLMSPTSFLIGSMVLAGLFVYDIVMVFYTPFMVTVATKIDAPIKMTFENEARSSLLGLGDIVLPGIFICLCLRFDLWRHYQKQTTRVPTKLTTEFEAASTDKDVLDITTETRKLVETKDLEIKAEFMDPQGRWGDWFWTLPLRLTGEIPTPGLRAMAFPKTYFFASMIGYAAGMALTVAMLLVFRHGQPALLYLVPCVTGAAWLTGTVRGELHDMWTYTEDGSLDTKDVLVDVDGSGNVVKAPPADETKVKADQDKVQGPEGTGKAPADKKEVGAKAPELKGYTVAEFILSAPHIDDIDEDNI